MSRSRATWSPQQRAAPSAPHITPCLHWQGAGIRRTSVPQGTRSRRRLRLGDGVGRFNGVRFEVHPRTRLIRRLHLLEQLEVALSGYACGTHVALDDVPADLGILRYDNGPWSTRSRHDHMRARDAIRAEPRCLKDLDQSAPIDRRDSTHPACATNGSGTRTLRPRSASPLLLPSGLKPQSLSTASSVPRS